MKSTLDLSGPVACVSPSGVSAKPFIGRCTVSNTATLTAELLLVDNWRCGFRPAWQTYNRYDSQVRNPFVLPSLKK